MNKFFTFIGAIVLWGVVCTLTGMAVGFAWAMGSLGFDFVVGLIR